MQPQWELLKDPLHFGKFFWPNEEFYDKQQQVIYSVDQNDETIVPAGHQLGKDFVTGFIVTRFLLCHHPVRIVTTSVKDDHLRVLWGEIGRYIQNSRVPLLAQDGGPLIVNHREIKKIVNGKVCPISYLIGAVSEKGEGMAGHHAKHTLLVVDEASGVDDMIYQRAASWAKKMLIIGNPYPSGNNYFERGVNEGDLLAKDGSRNYRKIIRIRATDSPNVQRGLRQQAAGQQPDGKEVLAGVLSWNEYQKRLATWDPIRICVGLEAEFYKGSEVLLFPPDWLNRAEELARQLRGKPRKAKAIGIDPAEGGDNTAMAAVDEFGLIELVSKKTPDTAVITGEAIAFMRKHGVAPENVCFDRGGGGKQHADRLRDQGYKVRTVAFGESLVPDPKRGTTPLSSRLENREERYVYKNRRAEMYGEFSIMLDPAEKGFAIPEEYGELRRQLSLIPKKHDGEGRLYMLPKNKRSPESNEQTLTEIIGCSPDEADAVVIAIHAMTNKSVRPKVGAF